MKIPLIKKILTVCCSVTVLTTIAACYNNKKCKTCDKSEISMTKTAKPERMTKRHHRKTISHESENSKDDDQ